jgi:hypothetical protein
VVHHEVNMVNQAAGAKLDPLWAHTSGAWLLDMGMMLFWSAVYVLAAWSRQLGRLSPRSRRALASGAGDVA